MIACTLGEGDLPARMAEWREFAAGSVTSVEMGPGPRVVRLHLRRGAAVLAAAASLRRREKDCCSFYDFSLAGGVLTVRVPDGAEAALDMFTGMLAVR